MLASTNISTPTKVSYNLKPNTSSYMIQTNGKPMLDSIDNVTHYTKYETTSETINLASCTINIMSQKDY